MSTDADRPVETAQAAEPGQPVEPARAKSPEESGAEPVPAPRAPSSIHPVLRYSTLRIALFVVVLSVTYLTGLRGLGLLAAALLVSGGLSLFLLRNQRDVVAGVVESRVRRSGRSAEPASDDSVSDRLDD